MTMKPFSGSVLQPKDGKKATSMVVMLHGVGSNGQDLISLAPHMAEYLPETVFVSPNAPQVCDMAPGMPNSYQWFSLQDRRPEIMLAEIQNTAPMLNEFLDDQLNQYGLDDSKMVMLGFSQGTMTSLYVSLRRKKPCAGVLGYSGAMIGGEEAGQDHIVKPPICLIHGQADDVVPFDAMGVAEKTLRDSGFEIETHARPGLGHSIDEPGLRAGIEFVTKALR